MQVLRLETAFKNKHRIKTSSDFTSIFFNIIIEDDDKSNMILKINGKNMSNFSQ